LIVSINLLRTASYREVDTAGEQIAQAIQRAPADLGVRFWDRLRALPEPAQSLAEIEMRRVSATASRLSFVKGNEAHGAFIAPRALAFVRHLLASKGTQGARYPEVWIVVVDSEVIIDLDDLRDAFSEAAETVPPNWTRLFFIPATDRNAIHALELNRRQT
jgi:hypothetical protein